MQRTIVGTIAGLVVLAQAVTFTQAPRGPIAAGSGGSAQSPPVRHTLVAPDGAYVSPYGSAPSSNA